MSGALDAGSVDFTSNSSPAALHPRYIEAISTPATTVLRSLIFVFVTDMQHATISGIGLGDSLRARIEPRRQRSFLRARP